MNEILQSFYRWFWISLTIAAGLGILLFIVTRRRDAWLRYTAIEAAFYIRLGISKRFAEASRRFSESRIYIYFLWIAIIVFLLLSLLNGKLYLHFLHRLPTKKPPEAESFYDNGAKLSKAGDYAGAITNFTKAIEIYSNYVEAYSFRARAKYNLEDYNGAIVDASRAIELNLDYEPAYNVRGFSRFALQDYTGSISDFNKSISLDSTYAPAYYQRGVAKANLTNYPAAIKDFTKAIELRQDYILAYYNRGLVEMGLTNHIAAIADFSSAIALHTNFAVAFNMRGLAKWYLTDYNGTVTDCTEAITLNPKLWEAYNNRGLAKNDLKNYAEAIVDLDKSIELNPHNKYVYLNRGDAEHHLKNNMAAITDFNTDIKLDPTDALAYANIGFIQNDSFQFEPALKNFQKALQLNPSQDEYRFRIWLIRSCLGDTLGATYDLNKYMSSLHEKKLTWSAAVGSFLVGSFSENNFLACAKSSNQKTQNWWRCRANYYVGMKHLVAGDKVGAMDFFLQCLNSKESYLAEYISAEAELNALKKELN